MERGKLRNVFPIKGQTVGTEDQVVMVVWQYDYILDLQVGDVAIGIKYPVLDELIRVLKANDMVAPSLFDND